VPADDKDHPISELLPILSPEEIENVRDWIGKDRKYEGEYRKMKEAMGKELAEAFGSVPAQAGNAPGTVGKALRWFEKDWREDAGRRDPRLPSGKLMWPSQKRLEKEKKFRQLGRKPVFLYVLSFLLKQIRRLKHFADLNLSIPRQQVRLSFWCPSGSMWTLAMASTDLEIPSCGMPTVCLFLFVVPSN
jgi:hypothetical protein